MVTWTIKIVVINCGILDCYADSVDSITQVIAKLDELLSSAIAHDVKVTSIHVFPNCF